VRSGSKAENITHTIHEHRSAAVAVGESSGPAALWRRADTGLWVGTVGGEYAGLIARHPDGFHAHDRWTRPVGVATTFDSATCLLAPVRTRSPRGRRTSPFTVCARPGAETGAAPARRPNERKKSS